MRITAPRWQTLALVATLSGTVPAIAPLAHAQDVGMAPGVARSAGELEQLVAPVALYADPLLAQLFLAATFPDQVREAADYVRAHGQSGLDEQWWDVSVRAVAHYPTVLNIMDQKPDWTRALGEAYATQSADVMSAVQRLRQQANANGNLVSNAQQQVVVEHDVIAVWPAQPNVIYVPVYNPTVVYVMPARYAPRPYVSFGIGFPLGAWAVYDWDWPARRIVYTGWVGGGWVARARPFIHVSAYYVPERYRPGYIGHEVRYARPFERREWDERARVEARERMERERRGWDDRGWGERERRGWDDRGRGERERRGWDDRGRAAAPVAVPRYDGGARERPQGNGWGNRPAEAPRGNAPAEAPRGRGWGNAPQQQPIAQGPRGGGRSPRAGIELGDIHRGAPPMISHNRVEGGQGERGRGEGERGGNGRGEGNGRRHGG
ncbi:MAG: DUF3300 domain-containing protein [Gemmatimonadetes bacterium]|nr:DUF3300 domain-containing protein [Gemmatimonadota bacterium]